MRSVATEVALEWMGVWPEREGCLGVTFQGFCCVIFGAMPLPLGPGLSTGTLASASDCSLQPVLLLQSPL